MLVRESEGLRRTVLVDVPEGGISEVRLTRALAELRFVVPAEIGGGGAVRISTDVGIRSKRETASVGPNTLQLPTGRYSLVLETGSERGYSVGPFDLTEQGLDLGEIQIDSASISGNVFDEEGEPWPGMNVELYRDDHWYGGQVQTAADGAFTFVDLAPGEYRVLVLPNDSHLLFQPDQVATIPLGSGEAHSGLRFVVKAGEATTCQLPPALEHPLVGFHSRPGWMETSPVDGRNAFLVGASSAGDWLGGLRLMPGRAMVIGSRLTAEQSLYDLSALLPESRELSLVDGAGEALAHAFVEFRVTGDAMLPGGASTDAEGGLLIQYSPALPLEMLVHLPDGGVCVVPVSSTPASGEVVVGGGLFPSRISCHDLDGIPIAGATVWNPVSGARTVTDAGGSAQLLHSGPGDLLRVEKAGFLPERVRAAEAIDLPLRRLLPSTALELPEGIPVRRLTVRPLFPAGTTIAPVVREGGSANEWELLNAAEGDYRVLALDSEGVILLDQEVHLRAGVPGPTRLR